MVLIMNSVDHPKLHKKLNNSCHKCYKLEMLLPNGEIPTSLSFLHYQVMEEQKLAFGFVVLYTGNMKTGPSWLFDALGLA